VDTWGREHIADVARFIDRFDGYLATEPRLTPDDRLDELGQDLLLPGPPRSRRP